MLALPHELGAEAPRYQNLRVKTDGKNQRMARRRSRSQPVFLIAVLCVGLGVALYALAMASVDYLAALTPEDYDRPRYARPHLAFLLWDRFVEAIVGVWFFVVGASVGSFLNVVVYRLPLGLSLVSQGSRCPFCLTPILARDNLPILGWIGLRGRCRACRLPISSRYPVVEALTGLMFLVVYGAELARGGSGIPNSWFPLDLVIGDIVLDGRWDLLGLYLYHMYFLCILWSTALMVYDGKQPPLKIWLAGFSGTVLAVGSWPWVYPQLIQWGGGYALEQVTLYPVPFWPISGVLPLEMHGPWTDVFTAFVGLASGLGVAMLLDRISFRPKVEPDTQRCEAELTDSPIEQDSNDALETAAERVGSEKNSVVKFRLGRGEASQLVSRPWVAGMLAMIGMAWGWQFLVGVLLLCFPVNFLLRCVLPRFRNLRAAAWALSLCGATLLVLIRWDGWQEFGLKMVTLVGVVP
jgi:hypothetical protein